MQNVVQLLSLILAVITFGTGATKSVVPKEISADGTVVASLLAEGAQTYECKAGSDGKLVWTFREPIATLISDGTTVGRHYAGPVWESVDGSAITGKVVASAPGATPDDIAWLKLSVVSARGDGVFSKVTTVQRIETHGGAVQGSCERTGTALVAPYSATYVFVREGN
ncbi:hypothetical protein CO669_07785 [Bradyrhizobium sp. Y36]|uniref:DUF3455 domain-containing protein n=1 Tax=Bradyrhizobium sp. Y36 TaxID=2035447 RepID=UPI000BE85148|nr:DUF3455 domain-containing protein [Bradyrhizobium sp. Y36]PDT90864.1 hypothetical protein CO669_07785 [Bradyrhizobium sp. Y36]